MSSFPVNCEIVELKEELNTIEHSEGPRAHGKERKPSVLKQGYSSSLEDDINKLFEAINLKTSSKGHSLSDQVDAGLSAKAALKKPMRVSVSSSSGIGFSEPVSLKQALRGLCISQASEMAAMKRLSKPPGSPVVSEAGKLTSLYSSVVVEAGETVLPLAEAKERSVEISLVPEESTSNSSETMPRYLHEPKKTSNVSVLSSPRFALEIIAKRTGSTPRQNEIAPALTDVGSQPSRGLCISQASEMAAMKRLSKPPGSPVSEAGKLTSLYSSVVVEADETVLPLAEAKERSVEISLVPEESTSNCLEKMPQYLQEPKKTSNDSVLSSPRFALETIAKRTGSTLRQNEIAPALTEVGSQPSKIELVQEGKGTSVPYLPLHNTRDNVLEPDKNVSSSVKLASNRDKNISASIKLANRAVPKLRRKGRLQTVPSLFSSINSTKVSKSTRNVPRSVKPALRNKNFVKKKSKQDLTSHPGTSNSYHEVSVYLDPGTNQLICQRCQCSLKDARKEPSKDSPVLLSASTSAGVSSTNGNKVASKPGSISNGCDRSSPVFVNINNSKHREKGEFSQSSKSSVGEYSSSTSISEESNLSGSSFGNRPHMSKDLRWEAIHQVIKQHGFLGLGNFNLLKKLGCGDIGTVYLAELIGTNFLFAIKVMDNEFLARRKKLARVQTEREILRILDHPFLPTLYSHFISDNLSCLVMEYCPGGDLHILRQKQPSRYFPEQAARFYVAEVLLALEYLHMLGVVYRDLKPENILVREDGHIMLTDFDLSLRCSVSPILLQLSSVGLEPPRISGPCAGSNCIDPFCIKPTCQVSCFSPRILPAATKTRKLKGDLAAQIRSLPQLVAEPTGARSNSFVGTHEYLAPEIIKGEGHGSAVDWWTFGIFLYELVYGKTPFKGSGNEETLANVVLQSLKFPDTPLVSFQARDLIKGLLVKEPENRLGSERGASEIKQHPFFDGLNWALIRCAVPPQIPELYGVPKIASEEIGKKYLDCGTTGEHLEFELF